MRTLLLIALGLVLAGATVAAAHRRPDRRGRLLVGFSVAWAAVTAWNLATGLSHGYGLAEELPVQAVILLVPVGAAWGADLSRRTRSP